MIVAGEFLFEQLLEFLLCFVKPVFLFSGRQANNFSRTFLQYGLLLLQLFRKALQLSHNKVFPPT